MKNVHALTVTVPHELLGKLDQTQKEETKTASSIVSEALREYFELRQFKKVQKQLAMLARAHKIYTEDDVATLIHQMRGR
jgi:metal-responsive CopG/Arc/MetJ family transcriptional regulator